MKLPAQVQHVFDRVDAMSLRERALLTVSLVAVLFMFWDMFLMQPLNAMRDTRADQVESLHQQIGRLNQAIQDTVGADATDPDTAARQQLAELRSELLEIDRRLESMTGDLIAPAQMGGVLEALLSRTDGLELVSMRNIEAQPAGVSSDGAATYFRHGIELEVDGGYTAVLRYLQAIEHFQWRFMWGSVELTVEQHPRARTRIVLYTLSQQEVLIGV